MILYTCLLYSDTVFVSKWENYRSLLSMLCNWQDIMSVGSEGILKHFFFLLEFQKYILRGQFI